MFYESGECVCSGGRVDARASVVGERLPHHSFPTRSVERDCSYRSDGIDKKAWSRAGT
jgi:hypothetical protein